MINLPVTLAGIVWNDNPELLARVERVINHCQRHFEFQQIVLFSYLPSNMPGTIQIPMLTRETYHTFCLKGIQPYCKSAFWMWINEDGFPLHPKLWTPEFLDYDFVGAPWACKGVGNDGFSLMSHRLLRRLSTDFPWHDGTPTDIWMAEHYSQSDVTVAPFEVARKFSREYKHSDEPSFGFHGKAINPTDYNYGWKIIEEEECKEQH